MADKKISELPSITGSATATDDYFVVVDTSGAVTSKISREELNNAIEQDVLAQVDITSANIDGGTIDNTPIGATTASTGNFTTVTADGLTVEGASAGGTYITSASGSAAGDVKIEHIIDSGRSVNTINSESGSGGAIALAFATGETERLKIANNGDISFYDSTGVTQGFFWDASTHRLGLGSTSPSVELSIAGSDPQLILWEGTDGASSSKVQLGTGAVQGFINVHKGDGTRTVQLNSDGDTYFTGGNVGIGTSSPAYKTEIVSSSDADLLQIKSTASANNTVLRLGISGNDAVISGSGGSTGNLAFKTYGIERLRIDSSGNLLVGMTSSSGTAVGQRLLSDGFFSAVRAGASGQSTAVFGKNTNDGDIVTFQKDGATVGSIGAKLNALNFLGSGGNGIQMGAGTVLGPANTSGSNDAAIDLGASNNRFKDLYLSGGVYLGGTGSANHLDDYEIGTFTPEVYDNNIGGNQITSNSKYGSYTKIGNLVTVHFYFYNLNTTGATAGNSLFFRNLPFTTEAISSQGQGVGAVRYHGIYTNGGDLSAVASSGGTTYAYVWAMGNNTADYPIRVQDVAVSGGSDIEFTVSYRTP